MHQITLPLHTDRCLNFAVIAFNQSIKWLPDSEENAVILTFDLHTQLASRLKRQDAVCFRLTVLTS